MDSFGGLSLDERKLVVGIDFGTTFSGLAWAETRRPDHQSLVESWPDIMGTQEGTSSVKVPTELRYTPEGIEWGFQIPPTIGRFKWFKLGLEDGVVSNVDGQPRSSEDLTADYLTELVKHLMYTLKQKLGAAVLRTIPLEFCLTVPAIWSEVAKEKTLKACQKAGLKSKSDILLVSEPEAAAIYALHGLDPHGLSVGESFVLCDAGGGTVDLISYTITDLHPVLKVKEAAPGTGDVCGSAVLNYRFQRFLASKMSEQPGWDAEVLAEAMERFESVIKKQYSPSSSNQEGYSILVPGIPNNEELGIRRGRFTVTPKEMNDIFEPVVGKIIELVNGQIAATKRKVKTVLLVGGFGQNNYLKERLRISLGDSTLVLQPPNAWTAVARGAVMMGLARTNSRLASVGLVSRAARKHYGVELNVQFKSRKHDESKKYWNDKNQMYKVREMFWFINKGEPVQENEPNEIDYFRDFLVKNGKPKSFNLQVFCDEKTTDAPVHRTGNVRKLVNLTADLSHLSRKDLKKTVKTMEDGEKYYSLHCVIEATFHSASTKYVLFCEGERYDTVTAEYA